MESNSRSNNLRRASSLDSGVLIDIKCDIIFTHKPQCSCNLKNSSVRKYCNNNCTSSLSGSCPQAHKWCHIAKVPQDNTEVYYQLNLISIESEKFKKYMEQIEIDITRTFPDIEYFAAGQGKDAVRRVLRAFVIYNYQLGYVQGMNYIVCSLLWHASEFDAFWLFVILLDEYKVRENYLYRFPGLTKHCDITEKLLSVYLPKAHSHFSKHNLFVQMFATDWYMTIFTSLVPIEYSHKVFSNFFKIGWMFAYKLLIGIVERLEKKLVGINDRIDMLRVIKPLELVNNDWKMFLASLEKRMEKLTWEKLISVSVKKNIDVRQIEKFLEDYVFEVFVDPDII